MTYELGEFADNLKRARISKGMTQKDLESLSGIPQAHLSKIESGAVDLKLSSLVELARLLEFELMLVPRKFVPAVEAIVRGGSDEPQHYARTIREIRKLRSKLSAIGLSDTSESARLRRTLREMASLRLSPPEESELHKTLRGLQDLSKAALPRQELAELTRSLEELRNRIVHKRDDTFIVPKPAYTLDDEDDDA